MHLYLFCIRCLFIKWFSLCLFGHWSCHRMSEIVRLYLTRVGKHSIYWYTGVILESDISINVLRRRKDSETCWLLVLTSHRPSTMFYLFPRPCFLPLVMRSYVTRLLQPALSLHPCFILCPWLALDLSTHFGLCQVSLFTLLNCRLIESGRPQNWPLWCPKTANKIKSKM